MKPTFRKLKRQMREVVHDTMAEPVLVLRGMSVLAVSVTARLHTSVQALGALAKGEGYAAVDTITPRIVFLNSQYNPKVGDLIIFEDAGAYQIGNVLPPDDITTSGEVSDISTGQATNMGWAPKLPWMGLPAPSNT